MEVKIYKIDEKTRQLLYLIGFRWDGNISFVNREMKILFEIHEDNYYFYEMEYSEKGDEIFNLKYEGLYKNINLFVNKKFLHEIRKAKIKQILDDIS